MRLLALLCLFECRKLKQAPVAAMQHRLRRVSALVLGRRRNVGRHVRAPGARHAAPLGVPLCRAVIRKALATGAALKGPLARVDSHVLHEPRVLSRGVRTLGAGMGPLARVRVDVRIECRLGGRGVVAMRAQVGPVARVRPHVIVQALLALGSVLAVRARVRALVAVGPHVLAHVLSEIGGIGAMLALNRLVGLVAQQMCRQVLALLGGVPAVWAHVRPRVRVCALVHGQEPRARSGKRALVAAVRALAGVEARVVPQVALGAEARAALGAAERLTHCRRRKMSQKGADVLYDTRSGFF